MHPPAYGPAILYTDTLCSWNFCAETAKNRFISTSGQKWVTLSYINMCFAANIISQPSNENEATNNA